MKNFLVIAFLIASLGFAQSTPPPAPTPDPCGQAAVAAGTAESNCGIKFRAETNFYQLSNGKQATQVSAIIPLTPRFAAVASQFFIPTAAGQITAVGPQFDEKLSHILGKKSANVTGALLNASKITLYGRLLLGSETNSVTNQRAFAGVLEGGARFPLANVSGVVVQARVGAAFIFVPHYDAPPERFFLGSNNAAATLGLNASF